jgi:hypothetical protein
MQDGMQIVSQRAVMSGARNMNPASDFLARANDYLRLAQTAKSRKKQHIYLEAAEAWLRAATGCIKARQGACVRQSSEPSVMSAASNLSRARASTVQLAAADA